MDEHGEKREGTTYGWIEGGRERVREGTSLTKELKDIKSFWESDYSVQTKRKARIVKAF